MPKDGQERAARGEGARKAASDNQARAAGQPAGSQPPGFVPGGQATGNGPLPVQIVNGENDFFDSLRQALGMGSMRAGAGNNQFETTLKSQQAISQAAQQISQDVKSVLSMMKTLQMSNLQLNVQMSQTLSQLTQGQQSMVNAITYGGNYGGGGGGPQGGGGGHGGDGAGYNPGNNQFVSYGSLQSRGRAALANVVNMTYGTASSTPKHLTAQGLAQHRAQQQHYGQIAGGIAHSGVMGGLRRTAGLGLGIAGAEAVDQGAQWLTQQRAQNAYYQGIYGGDNLGGMGDVANALGVGGGTVTSGLGGRMQEEGYVLGQRFSAGGMTGDQARQAFRSVSAMGLNGERRNQTLGFVSNAYKNMGMDPGQATQVAQVATNYAQTNLDGVYDSLLKVSKAAQQTGQSADALRQVFVGNYQASLSGGAQGGAAGLAQAMTMATAAGGRSMQGFSYSSMMSNPSTMYAMASRVGMTPTQLEYQSAMGNNVPMASAMTQQSGALMQSALGSKGQQQFNQLVQQAGGASKVASSPGTISHIATQLLPYVDSATIRSMVQATGITVPQGASDEQILGLMVNQLVGNSPEAAAKQQQAAAAPQKIGQSELDKQKQAPGLFGISWGSPGSYDNYGKGMSDWTSQQLADAQYQQGGFEETFGNLFGGNDHSKAANNRVDTVKQYADYQKQYGNVSDQAMQQAITMFGNDPNMRIRVRTKDGTDRAVSLKEAIQYYPDQISTGQASVMNNDADQNGKTLAELGITPSLQQGKLLPNEQDTTTSGQEYGQSAKDQEKNFQPKAKDTTSDGSGQNVTIDFAPGAAQTLLRVVGQSSPNSRPPASTNGPN